MLYSILESHCQALVLTCLFLKATPSRSCPKIVQGSSYKFHPHSEKWIPITIMALRRSTRLLAAAPSLEHSIHVSARSLVDESQFEFTEGNAPKRVRKRKLSSDQEPSDGDGGEYSMGASSKPPPMKRRAKVEPVTYVIPDVQRKETTYKGRLGRPFLLTREWNVVLTQRRICLLEYRFAKQEARQ